MICIVSSSTPHYIGGMKLAQRWRQLYLAFSSLPWLVYQLFCQVFAADVVEPSVVALEKQVQVKK